MKSSNLMANRRYHYIVIILGLFTILGTGDLFAQKGEKNTTLVGTWLFDEQHSFNKIDSDAKKQLDTIPQLRIQLEQIYRNRRMVFGEDGSFTILLSDGRNSIGNWTLTNDNILSVLDSQGNSMEWQLYSLSKTKMVLMTSYSEGRGKALIPETHYTKL